MYYDYTRYFTQIISLLTDIQNDLVNQMGVVNNILRVVTFALLLCVGLWAFSRSWRYRK